MSSRLKFHSYEPSICSPTGPMQAFIYLQICMVSWEMASRCYIVCVGATGWFLFKLKEQIINAPLIYRECECNVQKLSNPQSICTIPCFYILHKIGQPCLCSTMYNG